MDDVSPITQHIADIRLLSPSLAEVARDLRLLIFAVAQQAAIPVTEEIKYGGILFSTTKPFVVFLLINNMCHWNLVLVQVFRMPTAYL